MDTTKKNEKVRINKPLIVALIMGFASGLPLLLCGKTLQIWLTEMGLSLSTIGKASLLSLPYSWKFVWAPIFDRFTPFKSGRRRSWLMISQIALALTIGSVGWISPNQNPVLFAGAIFALAFFSASQDIVIDAYRRESLTDNELGMGATLYIYGYRASLFVSGALAIGISEIFPWPLVYNLLAIVMGLCIFATLWADEPQGASLPIKSLWAAVRDPLKEFWLRKGVAWVILFILLFKIGENLAGTMLNPMYIKLGYTKAEIALLAKTLSIIFTLVGSGLGGWLVLKKGIFSSLLISGVAQSGATLLIAWLTVLPPTKLALGGLIGLDDISTSMANAAFVAYLGSITNRQYSATQFALLSSLMRIPGILLGSLSGDMVEAVGFSWFFVACALITVPGLLLIGKLRKLQV